MNALAERWIAALRSGEYAQTQSVLHSYAGYCCLGVACDVIDPKAWQAEGSGRLVWGENRLSNYLNRPILEMLGLADPEQSTLAEMNDSGLTFAEIADAAERMLA